MTEPNQEAVEAAVRLLEERTGRTISNRGLIADAIAAARPAIEKEVRERLRSDATITIAGEVADDLDLGLSSEGAQIVADRIIHAAVTHALQEADHA